MKEIFLKSPLLKEIEKALELNRGDLADDIAYKILSDKTYIEKIVEERKTREKLQKTGNELRKIKEELEKERAARKALEKVANKTDISVTTNINVSMDLDMHIRNELNSLIKILESERAFEKNLLKKPEDLSTKHKIIEWLRTIKETIETSTAITEGIKAVLPLIGYLLQKLETIGY